MQNSKFSTGPIALTAAAANLASPPTGLTGGTNLGGLTKCFLIVEHIMIVNTGATTPTIQLFVGATAGSAAGTESFFGKSATIAANGRIEWTGRQKINSTLFISGLASVASNTCIVTISGEIGIE